MFDFSQMYNGQGGASAEEYAARLQAQMMAEQANRMAREIHGQAQAPQITPKEEAWWICKRASCQGWTVRIVQGQRIEWVKDGKVLAGSLSGNLRIAFVESCRYLNRFLEGTSQ